MSASYEEHNLQQKSGETDSFTEDRYRQFFKHLPRDARTVLDVGCSTGRGGKILRQLQPTMILHGLDCVKVRLETAESTYQEIFYASATEIPVPDCSYDAIVAGEFLEHLYPRDVDPVLCEFQRILKIGGRLLLTTPNPAYLRNKLHKASVYGVSHLTQHHIPILRRRLLEHGFNHVKVSGSGKVSRLVLEFFPCKCIFGSYLVRGDKV